MLALLRAQWLTFTSYRFGLLLSVGSLLVTVVPVYLVADALQPVVERSIRDEGSNYFGFLVLGIAATYVISAAANALPTAVAAGIRSGTFEALLATPTSTSSVLLGIAGFDILWAAIRSGLVLLTLVLLGGSVAWSGLPVAILGALLTILAYLAIGLFATALILTVRTAGGLTQGVLIASSLLGGVYYSTSVIPDVVRPLAYLVPLTYGLRASRRALLEGTSLAGVMSDLFLLALLATGLFAAGACALHVAMRHARRSGTIGQY